MNAFTTLGLSRELGEAVERLGYETPTPIQEQAIPLLLSGKCDFIGLAQTGTGKTAAFGLPLLDLISDEAPFIQGLILAPTRELCVQITGDLQNFMPEGSGLQIVAVYGGASLGQQIRQLKSGAHVVVATPGRLVDLLNRKALQLNRLGYLILDEADEMLNMGFKDDLDLIFEHTADQRRTWLFSATMQAGVRRIAKQYMEEPQEISVGERNSSNEHIEHRYAVVSEKDKYPALKRLLDFHPDIYALVFCRTKMDTQNVADQLIKDGYAAGALHGDMDQPQRDRMMNKFRNRAIRILVATDVAARGLDVNGISHVIHMNLPDEIAYYTHRSGRTGRAGQKGISIALVSNRDQSRIRQLEKLTHTNFRILTIPTGDEICQQQLMHLVSRVQEVTVSDEEMDTFLPEVEHALRNLSREDIIKRFAALEFNRFLDYYRDAPDLNAAPGKQRANDKVRPTDESGPQTAYQINLGIKDGMDKGGILRIICESGGIQRTAVGKIYLDRTFSTVMIAEEVAPQAAKKLSKAKYRGRPLKLTADAAPQPSSAPRSRPGKRQKAKW
ncbi:MAG: DEAD/DEAH box helicase [Lewinellaceae bacterium]|nr:DEAD/DEAH box helicase [Lewinellaceae bacterium]